MTFRLPAAAFPLQPCEGKAGSGAIWDAHIHLPAPHSAKWMKVY